MTNTKMMMISRMMTVTKMTMISRMMTVKKDDGSRWFFFQWYPPISVPKRKPPSSQSRPFLVKRFTGTASAIGWLAISLLVLKLGGTSEKNHPVYLRITTWAHSTSCPPWTPSQASIGSGLMNLLMVMVTEVMRTMAMMMGGSQMSIAAADFMNLFMRERLFRWKF